MIIRDSTDSDLSNGLLCPHHPTLLNMIQHVNRPFGNRIIMTLNKKKNPLINGHCSEVSVFFLTWSLNKWFSATVWMEDGGRADMFNNGNIGFDRLGPGETVLTCICHWEAVPHLDHIHLRHQFGDFLVVREREPKNLIFVWFDRE